MRHSRLWLALLATTSLGAAAARAAEFDPQTSLVDQQAAMTSGQTTAVALVRAYEKRIRQIDQAGPRLNSVIALNPKALEEARQLDAERKAGKIRGPLHGVTILLKDNIESADGTATTAGSLALAENFPTADAPIVARLRAAGAVILGKTNLSEWANYRSTRSISGWSGVGGLVRNPYDLGRTACGSSAGSGAAMAAGLAAGSIGTETDGSITCPSSMNSLVGLKPTVGLVSRRQIVPISESQDTAGPMTRTVADAAAILSAIAGTDPGDPATVHADAHRADYLAALDPGALKGVRIGVLRAKAGPHLAADKVFAEALAALTAAGAVLVEVKSPNEAAVRAAEDLILRTEFKAGVSAYLASTDPAKVPSRNLADLIAFNSAHAEAEMPLFAQEIFLASQATPGLDDAAYLKARADAKRLAGPEGIDQMLKDNDVVALVSSSGGPPSLVDPVNGGRGFSSPSTLPAVSGYPHLTVPMGYVSGLPVGISFIGTAWSEARLLSLGYAYEQATHARIAPTYPKGLVERPEIATAYDRPRP